MKIIVIKNKNIKDFQSWPIWSCKPSKFDWEYDQNEHCFIIEGKFMVIGPENTIHVSSGDYVIFPKGLRCVWKVEQTVKKYYKFIK